VTVQEKEREDSSRCFGILHFHTEELFV